MSQITIRYASDRDYPDAEAIMKQVHQLHVKWRPDIYQPADPVLPVDVYQKSVKERTMIVADCAGCVVGLLSYKRKYVEASTQKSRNVMFIDCVAVAEALRGQGIGRQLFAFAQEIFRLQHFDGLELQVNARNIHARKFYALLGFTEKSVNLEFLRE